LAGQLVVEIDAYKLVQARYIKTNPTLVFSENPGVELGA